MNLATPKIGDSPQGWLACSPLRPPIFCLEKLEKRSLFGRKRGTGAFAPAFSAHFLAIPSFFSDGNSGLCPGKTRDWIQISDVSQEAISGLKGLEFHRKTACLEGVLGPPPLDFPPLAAPLCSQPTKKTKDADSCFSMGIRWASEFQPNPIERPASLRDAGLVARDPSPGARLCPAPQ